MKATLQFRITQGLKMTPQLQQAIYLLQLSNIELNAMIQEQLDSNLMLETEDDKDENENENENSNSINSGEEKDTAEYDSEREFNENDSNIISKNKNNPENQYSELAFEKEDDSYKSLEEELRWQLNLMPITDNDRVISEIIIDSLNDDGFLEISLNEILNTANNKLSTPFPLRAEISISFKFLSWESATSSLYWKYLLISIGNGKRKFW